MVHKEQDQVLFIFYMFLLFVIITIITYIIDFVDVQVAEDMNKEKIIKKEQDWDVVDFVQEEEEKEEE